MTDTSIAAVETEAVATSPADLDSAIRLSERQFRSRRRRSSLLVRVLQVASAAVFLAVWEALTDAGLLDPLFFSKPSSIGAFIVQHWGTLVADTGVTIRATAIGFFIGSIAGIVAALAISAVPLLDRVLQPWISVLMSIPRIALAPLFLLWFGITETSKVALAVSLVFFMVLVTTTAGTRTIDSDLLSLSDVFHANALQRFRTIVIPGSVPAIMAGLRLGVVTSILGVVSSEIVASSSGLGQKIVLYGQNFNSAGIFAVLVFLAVITTVLNGIVALCELRLLRWQRA